MRPFDTTNRKRSAGIGFARELPDLSPIKAPIENHDLLILRWVNQGGVKLTD